MVSDERFVRYEYPTLLVVTTLLLVLRYLYLKTKSSLITSRSEGKRRICSFMFLVAKIDEHTDIGIESDISGSCRIRGV